MQYQYYYDIVPDVEPVMTLELSRKTGRIPKGTYSFLEYYCTDPGCDCRRVTLTVVNEKMKQKAAINFGFDQDGPFAGPYVDAANRQSPYAEDLLGLFVQALNAGPDWLDRLYRHYATVREKVDGKPYRGKPFPKAGKLVYKATPPPGLADEIEQSLRNLQAGGRGARPSASQVKAPARRGAEDVKAQAPEAAEESMTTFVARYVEEAALGAAMNLMQLHGDLRRYILNAEGAGEELAALLPALYQQSPQADEQIQGALRLLYDTLDLLVEDMGEGRTYSKKRMADLQEALGRHIFTENEDPDLCAAVTNILVQSRVDILPVLRRSNTTFMFACASRTDLEDLPAEDLLTGIARSFHSMGVTSPYEGAKELLQLLTMNEPELQTALIGEMFEAEEPLLRESAALMVFHHEPEVRQGVSRILSSLDGRRITPETLRRLIVSRNWLQGEVRKNVDQAISNARKARVECAPLAKPHSATVYASAVDAAGEQSFQVLIADGAVFARCTIVLKQGEGVKDSVVVPLNNKYEADDFIKVLKKEPLFLDSTAELLDLRVCNALAEGTRSGNVPNLWLVRVAELLGRDRWRDIRFDAARELLSLEEELASNDPRLLDEREYRDSVELSGDLYSTAPFLKSWHAADEEIDREIKASGARGKIDVAVAAERVLGVLEKRRAVWLERLVVTTLWLKSSTKPPVKWHRLYHVAQAVADESIALKEIPIMVSIAESTVEVYNFSKGGPAQKPKQVK